MRSIFRVGESLHPHRSPHPKSLRCATRFRPTHKGEVEVSFTSPLWGGRKMRSIFRVGEIYPSAPFPPPEISRAYAVATRFRPPHKGEVKWTLDSFLQLSWPANAGHPGDTDSIQDNCTRRRGTRGEEKNLRVSARTNSRACRTQLGGPHSRAMTMLLGLFVPPQFPDRLHAVGRSIEIRGSGIAQWDRSSVNPRRACRPLNRADRVCAAKTGTRRIRARRTTSNGRRKAGCRAR